jgi:hypothetical protein
MERRRLLGTRQAKEAFDGGHLLSVIYLVVDSQTGDMEADLIWSIYNAGGTKSARQVPAPSTATILSGK